jgi:hypothetical protein
MDSIEACTRPLSVTEPASLRCLGALAIVGMPLHRPPDPARLPRSLELLLRIVAAGPAGASAEQVLRALWPDAEARHWRRSLAGTLRAVDIRLGVRGAIAVEGDRITIDGQVLHVDSLAHERCLARVLNPFQVPGQADVEAAQGSLIAFQDAVFLPEIEEAWVLAARMRIDDARSRASRRLASSQG